MGRKKTIPIPTPTPASEELRRVRFNLQDGPSRGWHKATAFFYPKRKYHGLQDTGLFQGMCYHPGL
jgi:hypothetical protein